MSHRLKNYAWVAGVLLLVLVLAPSWKGEAQPELDPILSSYYVKPQSSEQMQAIADKFEVHHQHGEGYEIIVPQNRVKELLELAPDAKLLEEDIGAIIKEMKRTNALAGYHSWEEVQAKLKDIAEKNSDVATLEEYGKSKEGRPLLVLKLSDNVALDEKEPEVMVTSATHGDELISVEVVLGLVEKLIAGYRNKDTRMTKIIERRELFVIPVVNPDGFSRQQRYANGIDPNRDYPYPGNPDKKSNPAIQAIREFFAEREIVGSLDYHSSGRLIMYPWAYTSESLPAQDLKRFSDVAKHMAQANNYKPGQISKILYVAKGSSADYYYWTKKSLSYGIEIGNSFVPPSPQIPQFVNENAESTWRFIESFEAM